MTKKAFIVKKALGVNTSVNTAVTMEIAANDAMLIPVGNTSQRPSPGANGYFRYNDDTKGFEGYANGAWGEVGGGGGLYKGDKGLKGSLDNLTNIFRLTANTLSNNVTLEAGQNSVVAGPLEIANGFTLTIDTGARLSIV